MVNKNTEVSMTDRRWYDKDPILKEALELLKLSCDDTKSSAAEFILQLQEQVASEVIEHVYEIMQEYESNGNRWYDKDPVMMKAIELLRTAPKKTQRKAALKLLLALEDQSFENFELKLEE
ncbi:MAG: hypothetical protein PHC64_04930 [Candidatus Gastranaerophilales bacterium]|nr:hypothetical protein [Candidatus Gastranaerophilales bacterium]